jgi:hypothetical protein
MDQAGMQGIDNCLLHNRGIPPNKFWQKEVNICIGLAPPSNTQSLKTGERRAL